MQTTAMPGWRVATSRRKLAEPVEVDGVKVSSVVSEVTWTASTGGVRPGQFEDFQLSLGQLPTSGKLVFSAVQTYSGGDQVQWNQVSPDASAEPEHPAPTLVITAPVTESRSSGDDVGEGSSAQSALDASFTAAATTDKDSTSVLPTVLSAGALIIAMGAALLAWRSGRVTRAHPATPDVRS